MDVKTLCRDDYQEYITLREMPTELRRALKSHERVPVFIDNLAKELYHLPFPVSRETIKKCVYDLTEVFVRLVIKQSDERVMSDVEKMRRIQEADKIKAMDSLQDQLEAYGTETTEVTDKGQVQRTTYKI